MVGSVGRRAEWLFTKLKYVDVGAVRAELNMTSGWELV